MCGVSTTDPRCPSPPPTHPTTRMPLFPLLGPNALLSPLAVFMGVHSLLCAGPPTILRKIPYPHLSPPYTALPVVVPVFESHLLCLITLRRGTGGRNCSFPKRRMREGYETVISEVRKMDRKTAGCRRCLPYSALGGACCWDW